MSLTSRHLLATLGMNRTCLWSKRIASVSRCPGNIVRNKQCGYGTLVRPIQKHLCPFGVNVFDLNINSKCYCSNKSSADNAEDEELNKSFKNDPGLTELIKERRTDLSQDDREKSQGAAQTEEETVVMAEDEAMTEEEKLQNYYKIQEQIVEAEIQEMYGGKDEVVYDYEEVSEPPPPISLDRGEYGVFDIAEVVDLLKSENATDLCVIELPAELAYVNYMVIATARSTRQLLAVAKYIKRLYKQKRVETDPDSIRIEGKESRNWIAVDLGNIAVHLFLRETREMYDLETLWSVGPDHDDLTQLKEETVDPWIALLKEQEFFSVEGSEISGDISQDVTGGEGDYGVDVDHEDIGNVRSTDSLAGWQDVPEEDRQKPG